MRVQVLEKMIFFFLGLIVLALVYTQIIRGEHYRGQSVNNRIRVVSLEAPRGRILDRNGAVLADNLPSYNIAVIPQDIEDPKVLFNFLGGVLKKEPRLLAKLFTRRRLSSFDPVVIAEDVDRKTLIMIEENKFQYPGIVTEESFERFYPFHESGAHALGYVGRINPEQAESLEEYGYTPLSLVGKTGIEQFYESILQGDRGGRQIEVNSRGQEVRLLGTKASVKGRDINLTVDARLQTEAAQLLGEKRGSIVVMDVANGDVLTIVSSPPFDPNVFTNRSLQDKLAGYNSNPSSPLLNRSIAGQYPPGSVFKIPVALAAIERQVVSPDTTFDCPGYYMLGHARFGCTHVHGSENVVEALAHSCNVYFYHVSQMVTAPIIGGYAKAFGLSRPTGIDLPFEARGKVVYPGRNNLKAWFPGNTLNLSIGQGETLATPLQLTVLAAAVATDGIILRPRLLKAIDGKTMPPPDLTKRPIIRLKDSTWRIVQKGMQQVVDDYEGTGHLLHDLPGMTIWGKTGTAQAGKQGDHAWFVGYVRTPKSNLAFCVFLEHGGASSNAVAITYDLFKNIQAQGII